MEYISSLPRFHTHSDWDLQAQSSAVHIWLHLVSLKKGHEAILRHKAAKPLPAELNPGLTWSQQRASVYDPGYIVAKKILTTGIV
jgi:CxxC motif-containing protein